MIAKTLLELFTLSTNLYMISKDEEAMKELMEIKNEVRNKTAALIDSLAGEDDQTREIISKVLQKALQAKEELEKRADELARNIYHKMHIAHTDEIKKLSDEISKLKNELMLAEAKLINLEQKA